MADKKKKKKPNFLRTNTPKRTKIFWILCSLILSISGILECLCITGLISSYCSEPGMDIQSLFPFYMPFIIWGFAIIILMIMGFTAFVIYNYATNKEQYKEDVEQTKAESPLQGDAIEHEEEIIDLLTTIARPLPGRAKLNRARTAQFLRALMELGYIDKNTAGKTLMVWVETVTEYKDGNASHFQQAIKDATPQDSNVAEFQKQIQDIFAK